MPDEPSDFLDTNGSQPVPVDDIFEEAKDEHLEIENALPTAILSGLSVVGLGGSAGSVEALSSFFEAAPDTSGMAYVVIIHLSPEYESALPEILQRSTRMPVIAVSETIKVRENHVYVIPPGKHLSMSDGSLFLTDVVQPRGKRVAVDLFFRTLADSHGPRATAIVLSGGDADGAIGLKRIKERGGLTIAQDPDEAGHESMPRAAIATGMVDWVLPVTQMPGRLMEYRDNARRLQLPPEEQPRTRQARMVGEQDEEALTEVLAFLRMRTGHDFSYYKRATILRRIGRRMQVNACEALPDYLVYLRTHPGETGALLQDLLISVTNFFRDCDAFIALEAAIPDLFKDKNSSDQIRVWVAACATGEEAYSLAMLLCEQAARLESPPQIQVFATDIDEGAIEAAREGTYPESIAADVSEERLRRFFTKETGRYRVRRSLREVVLFALHDVLKDSPFSRLDLISCRNLLIYLNRDAQARIFDIFHFALRPDGKLFLGSSESAEEAANLFSPTDKKNRLYHRRSVHRVGVVVPSGSPTLALTLQAPRTPSPVLSLASRSAPNTGLTVPLPSTAPPISPRGMSWGELHFKLLERLAPPSLIVNRAHDILHLSETAGQFLQFAPGEPTMNLLRVVHPMLRIELRTALFRAAKTLEPVEIERAPIEIGGTSRQVNISVIPADVTSSEFLLIIFKLRQSEETRPSLEDDGKTQPTGVVHHLEEELDQIRGQWRETVEQYEASTEELKASNEELQAMNEELRSATEELETGREELQSINEELTTVNQELKSKVEELSRANSDLQNLMASTNIATIFLDRELRIKRYTPSTVALFNLIPTDVGRPLSDLTHRLEYPEIAEDAEEVLDRLALVEREVRNSDGRWFLARLLPYRTTEDQIAGVVLTCVDVTERREAGDAKRWLSAIVESSNDAIISFSLNGDIISWNAGAERNFGYRAREVTGKSNLLLSPPERKAEMKKALEKLQRGEEVGSFETKLLRKDGSLIDASVSISAMRSEEGELVGATAIAQDITLRNQTVEELRQTRDELEERVEQRTEELRDRANQLRRLASELTRSEQSERTRMATLLHDHVQQLLVSAKMRLEGMRKGLNDAQKEDVTAALGLLQESLDSSRSLAVELSPPILHEGLASALEWLGSVWMRDKYNLKVTLDLDQRIDAAGAEIRSLVFLAVRELLFNVVKHAGVQEATIGLAAEDASTLRVTVKDGGKGFDPKDLTLKSSGCGLGLLTVQERINMLGGALELRSKAGRGVEAVILVPRGKDVMRKTKDSLEN